MTKQEMQELDAWIAEHGLGWEEDEGIWIEPGSTVLYFPMVEDWSPTTKTQHFADVKREIEKRGWNYAYQCHPGDHYCHFCIWKEEAVDDLPVMKVIILGDSCGRTEELAGCLAFREAVEKLRKKKETEDYARQEG